MNDYDGIEILLAEDNPQDAKMAMRAFKTHNFLNRLYWVKDGVEVLDFIFCRGAYSDRDATQMPKVLLLDLKMPRRDGLDVLRELKEHESTRTLPVVIMTSSNQERDIVDSYRLGVNGYVTKPLDFASFTEAVAQIGMFWLLVNQVPKVP
jgi:two-component system response regulator